MTVSPQGPCKDAGPPHSCPSPPIPGWVCMTSRQKQRWQSPLRPGLGSQSVWLLDDLLGSGRHAARQFRERPRGQELRASHHCVHVKPRPPVQPGPTAASASTLAAAGKGCWAEPSLQARCPNGQRELPTTPSVPPPVCTGLCQISCGHQGPASFSASPCGDACQAQSTPDPTITGASPQSLQAFLSLSLILPSKGKGLHVGRENARDRREGSRMRDRSLWTTGPQGLPRGKATPLAIPLRQGETFTFCTKWNVATCGVFSLVSSALILFYFFKKKKISHILSSHTVIPGNHSGVKEFLSVKKIKKTSCLSGTSARSRGFQPPPAKSSSNVAAAGDQAPKSRGQAPTGPWVQIALLPVDPLWTSKKKGEKHSHQL